MSSNNSIFFALCSSILLSAGVLSLKCLESDEHGNLTEVINPNFQYCVLIKQHQTVLAAGGVELETAENAVTFAFSEQEPNYQLLSVCLFEKYDWPALFQTYMPLSSGYAPRVNLVFRCMCNKDLCNHPKNFGSL
uniref:Uncharacterized protein n=1 Tax=Acrobeloides nanus TaxID=290746 RepID=A0A914EBR8_9BILA